MRVLIVEDQQKLAAVLKRGFQEHGYAVDLAYDGDEGLASALVQPYDLVVLDRMLPRLDGLTVCQRLRDSHRNMPVLMLTARDTVDDRVAGLDSGADDYLVKPFAFRELLARARALIRRENVAHNPIVRIADLEVNTVTHAVRRAGGAIELTTKEYALLEYFLRNPDRILTRTQIAEHVWNYDVVSMSNVVDVYVRYLRRKLRDDHDPRLIRTIRGAGYQLCARSR